MQARNGRINRRQPAIRLLAQEFSESSLSQRGPNEFDPGFIITKLGAMVNRVLVAGLLEYLEPRDTSSGTMWQGQLRDASGIHYFNVGQFESESVQAQTEELAGIHESGEPILLMMVAKARCYTTEEGAVYTSMKPEEIAIIDRSRYANWLVEASEETMKRISDHDAAAVLAPTQEAYAEAGIASSSISGLLAAREFYGESDTEVHRLMVMRALDIAEGKREVSESSWAPPPESTLDLAQGENDSALGETEDLKQVITSVIEQLDEGKGVNLEMLLQACSKRGHDREATELTLDELVDNGIFIEARFGWFALAS